ncbi:hypothetical protein AB5I41_02865 [Sphingomonas sp. MMS24-JH45]
MIRVAAATPRASVWRSRRERRRDCRSGATGTRPRGRSGRVSGTVAQQLRDRRPAPAIGAAQRDARRAGAIRAASTDLSPLLLVGAALARNGRLTIAPSRSRARNRCWAWCPRRSCPITANITRSAGSRAGGAHRADDRTRRRRGAVRHRPRLRRTRPAALHRPCRDARIIGSTPPSTMGRSPEP